MRIPSWRVLKRSHGETSLIRAAQRGCQEAIATLIDRHWHETYRAAYLIVQDRGTAEDVAQEAMLAATRGLDGFDRNRALRPWLHRIVVRRSLDELRRPHRAREVSMQVLPEREQDGPTRDTIPDDITRALRKLDSEERALIVMRHLFGYEPSELAKTMGIPPSTVRTRLQRALNKLRGELLATEPMRSQRRADGGTP